MQRSTWLFAVHACLVNPFTRYRSQCARSYHASRVFSSPTFGNSPSAHDTMSSTHQDVAQMKCALEQSVRETVQLLMDLEVKSFRVGVQDACHTANAKLVSKYEWCPPPAPALGHPALRWRWSFHGTVSGAFGQLRMPYRHLYVACPPFQAQSVRNLAEQQVAAYQARREQTVQGVVQSITKVRCLGGTPSSPMMVAEIQTELSQ